MLLEIAPHGTQRQESDDYERRSDEQVQRCRRHDKRGQRSRILVTDVAQSRQLVAVHAPQCQRRDRLNGRKRPRHQVEVPGTGLDRLATPAPCRRQVPGHGQPDPPRGAGHAEEVEYKRDRHAPDAFQTFADDEERVAGS